MQLRQLKKKQKAFYGRIVSLHCPVLNETVYFTARGFFHLVNKRGVDHRTYPRKPKEQHLKLMCLKYVPEVVENSTQVQMRRITVTLKGKPKQAIHYELVHKVVSGEEIRVVIEKVGSGKHRFLSVMPHVSRRNKTKKRLNRRP